MKVPFYTTICLSMCLAGGFAQDVTTISLLNPTRKYGPIKQTHPKSFKRSPGHLAFLAPPNARILNKKTPLSVLQNGPYFINHYIYCDNLDQHTLEQIKSGAFSADKQIPVLDFQNNKFQGFNGLSPSLDSLQSAGFGSGLDGFKTSTYTGDKEIHILHLPKDKPHDFDDIKLHLSLLNAHGSPDAPKIDLDLNKNLGNFEVNLGSIKPPKLDASLLPKPTTSSLTEVVKPLIQGHVSGGGGNNYKINLDHFSHYLNEGKDKNVEIFQQHFSGPTDDSKEAIDVPHFEQHPLEHDPVRSSYNSPGAVDSYGDPIADPLITQTHSSHFGGQQSNLAHLIPNEHRNEFSSGFQNNLKNDDFYQPEEYFNQLNEIHELHRKRRQEIKAPAKEDRASVQTTDESNGQETRYPNHRYD